MKLSIVLAAILCISTPFLSLAHPEDTEDATTQNLAKVGDATITRKDLDTFFNAFFYRKETRDRLKQLPDFQREMLVARRRGQVLKQLIERQVVLGAAENHFLKEEKMEKVIEQMTDKQIRDIKKSVNSWVGFMEDLHQRDVTLRQWRRLIRDTILIQSYIGEEVKGSFRVRPVDIKRYYEENKENYERPRTIVYRQMILDPDACKNSESPKKVAQRIQKQVNNGADFARWAQKYALNRDEKPGEPKTVEVPEKDTDWMPPAVAGLEPGEVSDVQEVDSHYSIAYLERIIPAGPVPYTEVQNEIRERLRKTQRNQAEKQLLERLQEDVEIEILPAGRRIMGD